MQLTDVRWSTEITGDDLLLEIAPVIVSVLVRGRNAWHSTWVQHWFRNSHLFTHHETAQAGAERLRERGNVFYVNDVPGLLLTGERTRVAVIDGIGGEPFRHFVGVADEVVETPYGSYCRGIRPGVSVRTAVEGFASGSEAWSDHPSGRNDHVRFGVVADDAVLQVPSDGRLMASTSMPQGGGAALGWSPRESAIAIEFCESLAERWRALLDAAAGEPRTPLRLDISGTEPKTKRALASAIRKYRSERSKTIGSADRVQRAYEREIREAAKSIARANKDVERMWKREEKMSDEVWRAEEFAEDPWASITRLQISSEAIRKVRERASNAQLLVQQAQVMLDAATAARVESERALSAAESRHAALTRNPPRF